MGWYGLLGTSGNRSNRAVLLPQMLPRSASMPLLTDRTIAQTKPETARKEVADAVVPGLYLIVQPSGRKSWACRYRFDRRLRKYTLGPYPRLSLAAARTAARKALESVALGTDPIIAKRAAVAVDAPGDK